MSLYRTRNDYASWGRVVRAPHQVWRPNFLDELVAFAKADPSGAPWLPVGLRRSYGDTPLNAGGRLIDMTGLDRLISFEPETGVLEAEAGASLGEILDFAVPRGFFLPVTPGTKFVTLGGAVAIYTVAHSRHRDLIRALIADSAFSSYRGIAREKLAGWWLTWAVQWPLSLTIGDRYSPIEAIPAISPIPLLVIHNVGDPIIPVHHGDRLYAAAREPKAYWRLPEDGHITALVHEDNRKRLVVYLDEAFGH